MTPPELARLVEMAINGAKSANAGMQPADAFLGDLTVMTRTLLAGAVAPSLKARAAPKKSFSKISARKKSGGRK